MEQTLRNRIEMDSLDVSLLDVFCDFLKDVKYVNPDLTYEDLMNSCILAGGYMAKKNKMNKDEYLIYLRSIQIIDEHIPSYFVGTA